MRGILRLTVLLLFCLSFGTALAEDASSASESQDATSAQEGVSLSGTWICQMVPPRPEVPPTEMKVTHEGNSLTITSKQVRSGATITVTCSGDVAESDSQVGCESRVIIPEKPPQVSRSTSRIRISDEGRLITLYAEASESPHRSECRRK